MEEPVSMKEKEPGVVEEHKRRLDEYREKLAGLKSQSEGKLDDDAWKGVDTEVQVLAGQLRKTIAEAGLADLLKEISSAGSSNTSAAGSRPTNSGHSVSTSTASARSQASTADVA
mgnify:CR=1 FL=1